MNVAEALKPVNKEHLAKLTRSDLVELLLGEQDLRMQVEKALSAQSEEFFELKDKYIRLKRLVFEPSSEKNKKRSDKKSRKNEKSDSKKKVQKLSDRYKNVEVQEFEVSQDPPPSCSCCNLAMKDSGLREESEMLTVIPKKFLIHRQLLVKYRCNSCQSNLITSERPPRIKPGSSYSDALIIDVSLSKYCDLIPIERYCAMATRDGVEGLPQNSLIELTHYLAEFLSIIVEMILKEVLATLILRADETTHLMLGSKKNSWHLWGFSSDSAAYYLVKPTRAGSVASDFIAKSQCEVLLTDVYSGYKKATRTVNETRKEQGRPPVVNAYCNAHARRYFDEANGPEGEEFIDLYSDIYKIEKQAKKSDDKGKVEARDSMKPIFEQIKLKSQNLLKDFSKKDSVARAAKYFLNNYEGLTRCLDDIRIPLDNNQQESLFRNPVIGRKTWHGNHSPLGAKTTARLFTIIESCKLNKVNPRKYIPDIVKAIHENKPLFTPSQYRRMIDKDT